MRRLQALFIRTSADVVEISKQLGVKGVIPVDPTNRQPTGFILYEFEAYELDEDAHGSRRIYILAQEFSNGKEQFLALSKLPCTETSSPREGVSWFPMRGTSVGDLLVYTPYEV